MLQSLKGTSTVLATFALALWCALALPSAALGDEAETLYDPGSVFVIHLTLPHKGIEEVETEPDEYAETQGEFTIAATAGTPSTEGTPSAPVKVQIRLKGSASFADLSGKAAFKLKFAKGERPFGLKKMTLNNMVEDPSMTHETLAYEAFRAAAVPAPRTGFAYVYLNGLDYGMHLNVETVDDQALERIFGIKFEDPQHLYEGEYGTDVLPGEAASFGVDEGDEGNIGDLEALIGAVNGDGAQPWSTRVAPYADLAEMTRMWALEKYTGQWDGYSGEEGHAQPNNYYLYGNPLGQFQMLPWGTDETFLANHHLPFDGPAGVMFDKCLEDEACFAAYWHALHDALAPIGALGLPAHAAALDSMLAPWQVQEQGNGARHAHSRAEAHAAAQETSEFTTQRPAEAEAWLAAHVPPGIEEGGEDEAGGEESGAEGGGGSGAGSVNGTGSTNGTAAGSGAGSAGGGGSGAMAPADAARFLGTRVSGDTIRTFITVPDGGAVVGQRATYRVGEHRRTACVVAAMSHAPGELVLRCQLRRLARLMSRSGDLGLRVVTTVQPSAGEATVFRRSVTLAKP